MTRRATIAAAVLAGTVLRFTRRPFRSALRAAPGVLGAAAIAVGLGEVAGRVWGHGLTWWVALAVAGGFALWFGAELNARPPALPPE